jgi:Set1/Ash2 histone methyltransferase complex subunit ASH2
MCKSTHGVWDSKWYYEVEILNDSGCARIGYSQISGDLQAPCGYDQFSYSIRSTGGLFHDSNQISGSEPFKKGDILGLVIDLDKPRRDPKFPGLLIDTKLLTRLWDEGRMEEYLPFRHGIFETLDNSKIDFYVNGVRTEGFNGLFQGKYYGSISLYGGCEVKVNFGPEFKYFQNILGI